MLITIYGFIFIFIKVFSLHEISDIKIFDKNFITLLNFLKFCTNFNIFPIICNQIQAIRVSINIYISNTFINNNKKNELVI